jgi:hypothetical protein
MLQLGNNILSFFRNGIEMRGLVVLHFAMLYTVLLLKKPVLYSF